MDIMRLVLTARQIMDYLNNRWAEAGLPPQSLRQIQQELKDGKIEFKEKIGTAYVTTDKALDSYERRHPGPQGKK